MIKNYGPKNPTLGCNLGPNKQPPWCPLVWKQNDDIAVQYKDVHGLDYENEVYLAFLIIPHEYPCQLQSPLILF